MKPDDNIRGKIGREETMVQKHLRLRKRLQRAFRKETSRKTNCEVTYCNRAKLAGAQGHRVETVAQKKPWTSSLMQNHKTFLCGLPPKQLQNGRIARKQWPEIKCGWKILGAVRTARVRLPHAFD